MPRSDKSKQAYSRVTVEIPKELIREIEESALKRKLTKSELIRKAIIRYVRL